MTAVFERLRTLAFMKKDSEFYHSSKSSMMKAISSPQLVSHSLLVNARNSQASESKGLMAPSGHIHPALASIAKKRISIRILRMRELERQRPELLGLESLDDWALNVNSRTKSPVSFDADESSTTDSWEMSEDVDSSIQAVNTRDESPLPLSGLVILEEEKIVQLPGEKEEVDKHQEVLIQEEVDSDSPPPCSCCPFLWSSRARKRQNIAALQKVQEGQASGNTTPSWRLNIMTPTATHRSSIFQENVNDRDESKLKEENKQTKSVEHDELTEIGAYWTDNPDWVQPEDLCQITSLGLLGRGVEGGVTGVLHIPTCEVYALKSTNHHSEIEKYRMLKKLSDGKRMPQLMELNGLFEDRSTNKVALVVDYMNLRSLHHHFTKCNNPCSEEQMRWIARETLLGLRTLHGFKTPILHCDIKPNNILIASGGSVRIGDYGLLKLLKDPKTKIIGHTGSAKYYSPERHEGEFAMPADIWALGVSLVECLLGRLIKPEDLNDVRVASGTSPLDFLNPEGIDEDIVDFLKRCLDPEPEKRWDAERLLSHPVFYPDFLSPKDLFPAPAKNEALLEEILRIVQAFIRQRVELLGRASTISVSKKDDVWSHNKEVSHDKRLENIEKVTGYTRAEIEKFVNEMYVKRTSTNSHKPTS